jgi:adenylate kinase
MPTILIGRCDMDGAELVRRGDDGVEVFEMRLDVFKHETEPLIHYYRGHSLFIEVDADKSPSLVTRDIVTGLTNYRMQMVR